MHSRRNWKRKSELIASAEKVYPVFSASTFSVNHSIQRHYKTLMPLGDPCVSLVVVIALVYSTNKL